jgi:hypothetical protein
VPPSWRVPVPPDFPAIATPPEARHLVHDIARGAIATEAAPRPLAPLPPSAPATPLTVEEEREYVATRGQSMPTAPSR